MDYFLPSHEAINHLILLLKQLLAHVLSPTQIEEYVPRIMDILECVWKDLPYVFKNTKFGMISKPFDAFLVVAISETGGKYRFEYLEGKISQKSLKKYIEKEYNEKCTINVYGENSGYMARILEFMVFASTHLLFENSLLIDSRASIAPNKKYCWSKTIFFFGLRKKEGWKQSQKIFKSSYGYEYEKLLDFFKTTTIPTNHNSALDTSSHFGKMVQSLSKTILSVSPNTFFTPPFLLLRLQKEEQAFFENLKNENIELESISAKLDRYFNNEVSNLFLTGSDKISLKSITKNNDTIEARFMHQSIAVLMTWSYSSSGDISFDEAYTIQPCFSKLIKLKYYNYPQFQTDSNIPNVELDISLLTFLMEFSNNDRKSCPQLHWGHFPLFNSEMPQCCESSCNRKLTNHILSFSHEKARVNISRSKASKPSRFLLTWSSCSCCHRESERVELSEYSKYMSLGKFLEILFYNPFFTCHSSPLCVGTANGIGALPEHRDSISKNFLIGEDVISFSYEEIVVFEVSFSYNRESRIKPDQYFSLPYRREFLNKAVEKYWLEVYEHIQSLNGYFKKIKSKILFQYKEWFIERLKDEESKVKTMLESSEDTSLMILHKTIENKIIAIDREILHWERTILDDYSSLVNCLPLYSPALHPNSINRVHNIYMDDRQPSSFIAYALGSAEVRCVMDIINQSTENFESLQELKSKMEQMEKSLLGSNIYFETFSANSLEFSSAKLIDGKHIEYRYIKYVDDVNSVNINDPSSKRLSSNRLSSRKIKREEETSLKIMLYNVHLFQLLRTKYSISLESYVDSLAKCKNWAPKGGKSATRFFKTEDDHFILKQIGLKRKNWFIKISTGKDIKKENDFISDEEEKKMVLSVTLKYLYYMLEQNSNDSEKCSLLVKILGVYGVQFKSSTPLRPRFPGVDIDELFHRACTITIQKKPVSLDMHFVVMENLLFKRNCLLKFDLKGIHTRAVYPDGNRPNSSLEFFKLNLKNDDKLSRVQTLWDGDWLKSLHKNPLHQQKFGEIPQPVNSTIFIHPHSKKLLRDILKRDAAFLKTANITDYSLLVGIDQEKEELVMGIVDYLGEYNFWKKLENQWKTTYKILEKTVKDVVEGVSMATPETFHSRQSSSRESEITLDIVIPGYETPDQRKSVESGIKKQQKIYSTEELNNIRETVTVQPPDKYSRRFLNAMESYFPIAPDKFNS